MLTVRTITKDLCVVQTAVLLSSHSWSTVTMSKGGEADPLPKYLHVAKSKEAVADPTWVQSTIATRYGYVL